jgi:hypothetical protein
LWKPNQLCQRRFSPMTYSQNTTGYVEPTFGWLFVTRELLVSVCMLYSIITLYSALCILNMVPCNVDMVSRWSVDL